MNSPSEKESLFINAKEVSLLIGVSRGTLRRMQSQAGFPKPFSISRRLKKWKRSDIMAWIESQGGSSEVNN